MPPLAQPRQQGNRRGDFFHAQRVGNLCYVRRQAGDGLLPELAPGCSQPDLFAARVIGICTHVYQPALFKPGQRMGHAGLWHLKRAGKLQWRLTVLHPDQVVDHGEMWQHHPIRQPRLEGRTAQLIYDADFVEQLEIETSQVRYGVGVRHYLVLASSGFPAASAACAASRKRSPEVRAFEPCRGQAHKLDGSQYRALPFQGIPATPD